MRFPAIRQDIAIEANSGASAETHPYVIVDQRLDHRLQIDDTGHQLVDCLSTSRSYGEIVQAFRQAGMPLQPLALYSYLVYFYRFHLFDDARYARYAAWFEAVPDDAPTTLLFTDEARHLCQASGSCCGHTDIGPIPPERKRRLLAVDWTPHLPHIRHNDELFQEVEVSGELGPQITLLARGRQGYCSFLDNDKLCTVHKLQGFEAKPLICRQFPFVFTQTPTGIAVSIMMECRDYLAAKRASAPLDVDRRESLEALVAEGATIHRMPRVVALTEHLLMDSEQYNQLERELLAQLAQADQPIAATLLALRDRVAETVAALETEQGPTPEFLSRRAWKPLLPQLNLYTSDEAGMARAIAELRKVFSDAISTLTAAHGAAGDRSQVTLLENLLKAVSGLFGESDFRFFIIRDPSIHSVLRDILVNYIFSKEMLREQSLVDGLARGALKVLLTQSLAITLASFGCRGEILGRDVVDACVVVNKALRDARIKAALTASADVIRHLFFHQLQRVCEGNR